MHRRVALSLVASAAFTGCMPTVSRSAEDMTDFWKTIATLRGGPEERASMLAGLLAQRSAEDRRAFGLDYWRARNAAYSWDLWGAGYVLNGGMSDDGFEYFLAWLISQGQDVYEAALRDPETLADIATPYDVSNEDFLYAATEGVAFEDVQTLDIPFEPSGTSWTEEDLPTRYPRIWALVE